MAASFELYADAWFIFYLAALVCSLGMALALLTAALSRREVDRAIRVCLGAAGLVLAFVPLAMLLAVYLRAGRMFERFGAENLAGMAVAEWAIPGTVLSLGVAVVAFLLLITMRRMPASR